MREFATILTIVWMLLTIGLLIASLISDGQPPREQEETTNET